ncbi:DASS family sodium-coupled anion symporter [Arenibacter sp. GZD96]|uniref:SLC13 family permease n=1 Tax=Aurantibrevibacter litoralis TaxID=3106030 RepID=UPI002AFE4054|nr:DASS family sodium-coupled anion symporter [Arenibacter sp. GZD-96]MEA1785491.1 DASS family sodium-coupled anion symporter [Arenibacter sp. GZD-96]
MNPSFPKRIGLVLGPLSYALILNFFHPAGLSHQGIAVLAVTLWVAIWWITEAIPIAVTSMLPVVLFPLSGALSLSETTVAFGDKYIFLYIGGFILSIAIEKWNLHKRIALTIINYIGTNSSKIVLGFMLATAFLSMWISNTATAVMMLPIGLAIVKQFEDHPDTVKNENQIFGKALMLAIAYSASIGGIATLIGTPPNIIFAGVVQKFYNTEITFLQWFQVGFPLSIILLIITWQYLTKFAFPLDKQAFPGGKAEIKKQLKTLGKISTEEKWILVVFIFTALSWMTRSFVLAKLIPGIDDTIIAMIAAFILFIIPSKKDIGGQLLHWTEAERLPWGILLLFGGGLAIAGGFDSSGLASWIGNQVAVLDHMHLLVLVFIIVLMVNFLTEITSNLATTAMLLPVLVPVAAKLEVNPFILMVGATLAASCAFMLPVATPPNAVVFGSGYLRIPDMMKTGIFLNLVSIILITIFVYWILPLIWVLNG